MISWLMDAYRKGDNIVLWLKTPEDNIRLEKEFDVEIYVDKKAEPFLIENDLVFTKVKRKTYLRNYKEVLRLKAPVNGFEKFIRDIEKLTRHRIPIYDADIKPEQMFLYKNDLRPCSAVIVDEKRLIAIPLDEQIPLKRLRLNVIPSGDIYLDKDIEIESIQADKNKFEGTEEELLREFAEYFNKKDPDEIIMDYAYSRMPYLYQRLRKFNINCLLNRWDDYEICYKGGKSYWSYGQVRYQDYAVKLRGRFLIDTNSFVGTECEPEAIMELAQLSGTLFQQTASRSFGAAFQTSLIREMIMQCMLVPYKEKPIEPPLNMLDFLKSDRAAHTFDPKVGFHDNVAEIDFTSMFPWLIYNHNISADCILSKEKPRIKVPGVPITTSIAFKGLIPTALKPFIDRRMYYKKNPSTINNQRAKGLKWVLVSCYGYLRFREFKLGIPTSHMAICSYARETLLDVIRLAEEKGFEVVHAIVDSLYIKKKDITKKEVEEFIQEIELLTGIPIHLEGIFKWVVFLPSVTDQYRPLPSTYYGVFKSGDIKARGIEMRQRSVPRIVALFQEKVIAHIKDCNTIDEIKSKVLGLFRYLRKVISTLPNMHRDLLTVAIRVSKTDYKHNIPQKKVVEMLQRNGIRVMPGQFVRYIFQKDKIVLPKDYDGIPDIYQYKKLLVRSLFVVLQVFGYTRHEIGVQAEKERQALITEYTDRQELVKPTLKQMHQD